MIFRPRSTYLLLTGHKDEIYQICRAGIITGTISQLFLSFYSVSSELIKDFCLPNIVHNLPRLVGGIWK